MAINTKTKVVKNKVIEDNDINILKTENNELKIKFDELDNRFNTLMTSMAINTSNREIITANDRALVTYYILGRNGYVLNGKTIIFPKLGSSHTLGILEINDLVINEKYKSQVENGLVIFEDDKWYAHFGIIKPIPLNDENFKEILINKDTINKFNELSQYKKDEIVLHELMYRTAQLIKKHKVKLEFEKIIELEKYFNVKFDTLVALVENII